jgi:DNA polymerase delta subunit 1
MNGVITGLDFASLYPTIMRAHNLCYNSIVLDEKYNNLPGIEYKTVEWTTKEAKHFKYTFAQNPTGILPKLLETLAKNRKQAKKDMANASDPFMKDVYNGKQLAFKVSMNSIYGFCSAFMLPCQAISASVTTIGREMIEQTKTLVEEWYPNAEVVYGDTDSVMVKFDTTDAKNDLEMREISFRLGEEAAGRISQTFKYPIELEFEKCYQPYLLFSKKRYAGLMYTQVAKPDYIDAKGIQLVRRDNAPFVKDISKQVLNMIMYDQDILGSIDKVQDVARKLLNYEFSIDQLVISKSIRNDYVNRNHAHVKVADKIEQRNPGAGPKSGERVPYIIMDNGERLLCDRAEDPAYVVEKGLEYKVDVLYYLTNGLISPLESFYDLFMDHSKEGIFGDMIRDFENQRKGLRNGSTLNQFYERTKEKKPLVEKKKALLLEKANEPAKKTQRTINLFF